MNNRPALKVKVLGFRKQREKVKGRLGVAGVRWEVVWHGRRVGYRATTEPKKIAFCVFALSRQPDGLPEVLLRGSAQTER